MTERVDFRASSFPLQSETVPLVRETDISTGRNSHVFCAIDISVQTRQLLAGGERAWEKKEAEENGSA